jgi:hypothetical protein
MTASLALVAILALATDAVDPEFVQVAPKPREAFTIERTKGQRRAVVLIQGLYAHPFSNRNVLEARLQRWQRPGSDLVKALGGDSDVFAFAYSQNVEAERIAEASGLGKRVRRLKELGYSEIVLVGHSAGGLIARQLVEEEPDVGVTKIIQVCPPNGGTSWAKAELGVRRRQEPFLESLTKKSRQQLLAERADKKIPDRVEFVVLAGRINIDIDTRVTVESQKGKQPITLIAEVNKQGDGVVSCECQWPKDLQEQGIPVVVLPKDHFSILRGDAGVQEIAKLVREPQPRWKPERVAEMRRALFDE